MADHMVYRTIINAVENESLIEPFTRKDFQLACPGLGDGTYQAFLPKHRKGNPSRTSELFEMVGIGKYRLIRPFLYDL